MKTAYKIILAGVAVIIILIVAAIVLSQPKTTPQNTSPIPGTTATFLSTPTLSPNSTPTPTIPPTFTPTPTALPTSTPTSTPIVPNIEPAAPHYLPYTNGNESRIFLVSATPTYGSYPGPSVPQMGSQPGVQKGDPCFIINVTIRSDYTVENPLPGQDLYGNHNSTEASIFLTAQIFTAQGLIKATDVTPPYPGVPFGGAYLYLNGGENAAVTIYLATNHQDIDHFEIVPEYIGAIPPP